MMLNVQFTKRATICLCNSKCMVNNRTPIEKGRAIGYPQIDSTFH